MRRFKKETTNIFRKKLKESKKVQRGAIQVFVSDSYKSLSFETSSPRLPSHEKPKYRRSGPYIPSPKRQFQMINRSTKIESESLRTACPGRTSSGKTKFGKTKSGKTKSGKNNSGKNKSGKNMSRKNKFVRTSHGSLNQV